GHNLNDLKYKAILFPFGPLLAMALCLIVIFGQFYANADFSLLGFLVAYIGAVLFLAILIIYKVVKKTRGIKPEDADLSQGFAKK
ncbi:MAG: gamma-aminobutyrate permease, partial [Clostridiales Family XIII bacterium]|nr:gamma-aminobutyrate permease [Clostridiales Family XIII bacterium]